MTILDDKLVPKVLAIIAKFGLSVKWSRNVLEIYNPNTGEGRKENSVDITLTVSPPEVKQENIDGVLIISTSVLLAASGLSNVPEVNDNLTIGTTKYVITKIIEIWSGAQVAAYELICQ